MGYYNKTIALTAKSVAVTYIRQKPLIIYNNYVEKWSDSIVATGNNSQANAVSLTATINNIITTSSTENSAKLPLIENCLTPFVVVRNLGVSNLNLFPAAGQYIREHKMLE